MVNVSTTVWELDIAVVDPNGDNFTLSVHGGVVNAFLSELVSISPGAYVYRLSITDHSQLDVLEPLVFTATDVHEAGSFVVPLVEICGCVNEGDCTEEGLLNFHVTLLLNCDCPDGMQK